MLVEFKTNLGRSRMRKRLAPAIKNSVSAETVTADAFLDALEATGYWVKWGMPAGMLRSLWRASAADEVVARTTDAVETVLATIHRARRVVLESPDEITATNSAQLRALSVVASDAIKERMRAYAVLEGVEWMCERELALPLTNKPKRAAGEIPQSVVKVVDHLSQAVHDFDMVLQQRRWGLSLVANTTLLSAMRASIPDRALLPWWLDGTLELISLAHLTPNAKQWREAWRARAPAMRREEYRYFTEEFVTEIVTNLDGKGIPVERPTAKVEKGEEMFRAYDWEHKSDGERCRVRLIAPLQHSAKHGLKLQVVGYDSRSSVAGCDGATALRHDDEESEHSLLGKMMFVNGLMFRWTDMGTCQPVCAKLGFRGSPMLPDSGQMIMVDCQAGEVLRPAGEW